MIIDSDTKRKLREMGAQSLLDAFEVYFVNSACAVLPWGS